MRYKEPGRGVRPDVIAEAGTDLAGDFERYDIVGSGRIRNGPNGLVAEIGRLDQLPHLFPALLWAAQNGHLPSDPYSDVVNELFDDVVGDVLGVSQMRAELETYRGLLGEFERKSLHHGEDIESFRLAEDDVLVRFLTGCRAAYHSVIGRLLEIRKEYAEKPPEPPAEDSRLEDLQIIQETQHACLVDMEGQQEMRDEQYRFAVRTLLDVVGRLLK